MPSVAAPCQISSGEKAWMWISRADILDGAADRKVGRTVIGRVNAALQAELHRAAVPGFDDAALDFFEAQIVGTPAQIFAELAL